MSRAASSTTRQGHRLDVTSLTNDRIKLVRSLEMRKSRREHGLFVAEGASVLMTARARGVVPRMLIARTGAIEEQAVAGTLATWALDAGADVIEVSEAVLGKISSKENPQAVLGVFPIAFATMPAVQAIGPTETWIALEEVRDPGNLGTIIRTADAAGVSGVILAGTCCDPHQRECVRATMGSIFSVPLVTMPRDHLLDLMAVWPGDTIATAITASADFRAVSPRSPELVIMGREGPGLTDAVTAACSLSVKIPMSGDIDSLNLAIATALIAYQVRGSRLHLR